MYVMGFNVVGVIGIVVVVGYFIFIFGCWYLEIYDNIYIVFCCIVDDCGRWLDVLWVCFVWFY